MMRAAGSGPTFTSPPSGSPAMRGPAAVTVHRPPPGRVEFGRADEGGAAVDPHVGWLGAVGDRGRGAPPPSLSRSRRGRPSVAGLPARAELTARHFRRRLSRASAPAPARRHASAMALNARLASYP